MSDGKVISTLWRSLFESRGGKRVACDWEEWLRWPVWQTPAEAATKDDRTHGWSAAAFLADHRLKENVETLWALVLDYEVPEDAPADLVATTPDEACDLWAGCAGLLHTSYSHTPDDPRFRLVLPLNRTVTPAEYAQVWRWAAHGLSVSGHSIDVGCKDPSRLWFLPVVRPGGRATYEVRVLEGGFLDVDAILAEQSGREAELPPPAPLPPMPRTLPTLTEGEQRFAQKALEGALDDLRSAGKGSRHNTIRVKAYHLAGLIHTGAFTATELEDALVNEARRCGWENDAKTRATVRYQIRAGLERPRQVPDLRIVPRGPGYHPAAFDPERDFAPATTHAIEAVQPTPAQRSLRVERAILGTLIADGVEALDPVADLEPGHMQVRPHTHILQAIRDLHAAGHLIDLRTVASRLEAVGWLDEVGGDAYLAGLIAERVSVESLGDYARIILDGWAVREAGALAERIAAYAKSPVPDAGAFLAKAKLRFDEISTRHARHELPTDLLSGARSDFARLEALAKSGLAQLCPSGLGALDEVLGGGWKRGKSYVVGARPGGGKTAVGLSAILACAATPVEQGGGAALFLSIELPGQEVRERLYSTQIGMPSDCFADPARITAAQWEQLGGAVAYLASLPIHVVDTARTVDDIRAIVRRIARQQKALGVPLRLVVVDYVQMIRPPTTQRASGDRQQDIAAIGDELATLRREHPDVTQILLAQLKREVDSRKDPRPTMGDFGESSTLEKNADAMIVLWKPEGPKSKRVTLGFAKHRGGAIDIDVELTVDNRTGQVREA
jgi:replicative DNA helicase